MKKLSLKLSSNFKFVLIKNLGSLMTTLIVFMIIFMIGASEHAGANQTLKPDVSMNGIFLGQFGDYTKNWNLVTVRYRKDTGELRFTYANPTAFSALSSGTTDYPNGSVFAKVGFKSGIDPAFNSSVVPSGARRFQFMVRDKEKYTETDGWGYALFDSEGQLFPGDMNAQTISCHACHKLVSERNYVFSEKIEFSPFLKAAVNTYSLAKNKSHLFFEPLKVKSKSLKAVMKKNKIQDLQIIAGDLRQAFFSGTLDEVTPVLINKLFESKKSNHAAGFVSLDEETFKVVLQDSKTTCPEKEKAIKIIERRQDLEKSQQLTEKVICYPEN